MQAASFSKFSVIESTLREGEQFEGCHFSLDDKLEIAAGWMPLAWNTWN